MAASSSRKTAVILLRCICRLSSYASRRIYSCEQNNQSISLKNIFHKCRDIGLRPYGVECTRRLGRSFKNAQVHPFPYCVDENGDVVDPYVIDFEQSKNLRSFYLDFMPLFSDGIKRVESIISEDRLSEENIGSKFLCKAVHALDNFLHNIEFHQRCLSDMVENTENNYTELETTILLANHLFSPLANSAACNSTDEYCIITKESKFKISNCPCAEQCDTKIVYGNSSFGSEYLWFGRADIMVYPVSGGSLNVIIKKEGTESVNKKVSAKTNRQTIASQIRTDTSIQQVVSQAITFSLYQRKCQMAANQNSVTTLIPTIIASKHYFDVYLYDSENDILVRNLGGPTPIFEKHPDNNTEFNSKFDLSSIVILWLLINHLSLHPEFTANQLNALRNTCGVRRQIETLNLRKKVEDSLIMTGSHFSPPGMRDARVFNKINC